MLSRYFRKALLSLCTLSALTGCGGGGGGSTPEPPTPVNRAPVLTTTALAATEDTTLNGQLAATDPDGNTMTFTRVDDVQHGTITISAAGAVVYTPAANYAGADTFSVRVSDSAGAAATGTVTITVAGVNDAPAFTNVAFTTAEDTTLAGQLAPSDTDSTTLTVTRDSDPQHGLATVTAAGGITYIPLPNFFGTDTFNMHVADGAGDVTHANVTITITAVNDTPVAVDDEFLIATGAPRTMAVTGNDSDVESGTLTVSITQQPQGGTVSVGANNLLTFTPVAEFTGPINFTYRLTDANGGYDEAAVRAVMGDFQSLVYLADDQTPGRNEIYLYDGLSSTRLVPAPANSAEAITRFTISDDGSKLLYVVASPMVDSFFIKTISAPGAGTKIWSNDPLPPAGTVPSSGRMALNRSGSYAIIEDRYSPDAKRIYVVNTSTFAAGLLGGDEPQVVLAPIVLFNPQNENQVVLQGQIGGTASNYLAAYYSAFVAAAATPRDLTQIGADYPQLQGSGSGFGFWFGGAGRYIWHTEYLPNLTPLHKSLLMYDNTTHTESLVYRRPTGNEYGHATLPNTNTGGSKIVFSFTVPNPLNGDGPASFYMSDPATPTVATLLGGPYPRVGRVLTTAVADTVVLEVPDEGAGVSRLFARSLTNPGIAPMFIGKNPDPGEVFARTFVARRTQRLVVGYRIPPSEQVSLYNYPLWTVGAPPAPFTTTFPYSGGFGEDIDDDAQFLAYAPLEGSRRVLRIISTRANDYSIPLMSSTGTGSIIQYRWLPRP